MDVTRERVSRILELREILLSFQTGFNLVNIICAVQESLLSVSQSHKLVVFFSPTGSKALYEIVYYTTAYVNNHSDPLSC